MNIFDKLAPLDVQHATALIDQIGQTGADNLEVGWLDDHAPYRYYAKVNYQGQRIISDNHPAADFALMGVARKILHGGLCTGCKRTITFPHLKPGHCSRVLVQAHEGDVMVYKRLCTMTLLAGAVDQDHPPTRRGDPQDAIVLPPEDTDAD